MNYRFKFAIAGPASEVALFSYFEHDLTWLVMSEAENGEVLTDDQTDLVGPSRIRVTLKFSARNESVACLFDVYAWLGGCIDRAGQRGFQIGLEEINVDGEQIVVPPCYQIQTIEI